MKNEVYYFLDLSFVALFALERSHTFFILIVIWKTLVHRISYFCSFGVSTSRLPCKLPNYLACSLLYLLAIFLPYTLCFDPTDENSSLPSLIGHNFGSNHDPFTTECSPSESGGGKFMMYATSVSGLKPNNKVAMYMIHTVRKNEGKTLFKDRKVTKSQEILLKYEESRENVRNFDHIC